MRRGCFIAILGVDGAGKSTIINAIKPILDEATRNISIVQHLRPGLLPSLSRLRGRIPVPDEPILDPHGSAPSGVIGSLIRLSYLTVDYVVGYWLKIRPKIIKQAAIVIFDRYAYDMTLDPRRFRIGLSGKVAGWFVALVPKPDLILCLYASPDIIAARKRELPMEEINRQIRGLQAFARKDPRAVLIANEGCVDELREHVLRVLFDFLSSRLDPSNRILPEVKL